MNLEKLKPLWAKYRDVILYLFFGGCTTLVNIICYFLTYEVLHIGNVPSTAIAWLVSVLFAYVTNRSFVFVSKASGSAMVRELVSFFGCRIATGLLDLAIMWVAVDTLHLHAMLWKILSNVLVIVLNYVASKLLIFKKQ